MRSSCVDTSHDSSNRMQFMLMRFAFVFRKGRNKKDKTDGSGDGGGGAGTPTSGTVGIAGDECSKLYLRHANMQRFVKNHHLRQIIPLPPEIDLNEWLASQCTSFQNVFLSKLKRMLLSVVLYSLFVFLVRNVDYKYFCSSQYTDIHFLIENIVLDFIS